MKKPLLITAALAFASLSANTLLSQMTITLQPNGTAGKDALLSSLANTTNYGNHPDFLSVAWTNGGNPTTGRSLLQFDFSAIPPGATIVSAALSLYAYDSPANGSHSTMDGPNTSYLQRVTESWDESTVTWNTQPAVTTVNQVIIPSASMITDVVDLNVTSLVSDMFANGNNGFMIRLSNESYYRRMVFASSDNADAALHPKLVITYTTDNCLTLRPGHEGKDAIVSSLSPDVNYGNHTDFLAVAWTNGGDPVTGRSFLQFDYSGIPAGNVVQSAMLSLYAYDSPSNGSHSTMDGPNTSYIRRVTENWNETTITWNNQPATTTAGQVTIASASVITDAADLDVTALVSEMMTSGNYGFELQLDNETYYRRMIFASGDNTNADLHPKLVVCYAEPAAAVTLNDGFSGFELFPNPSGGKVYLRQVGTPKGQVYAFSVYTASGQLVYGISSPEAVVEMDLSGFEAGVYFVRIGNAYGEEVKKLVLQ